MLLCAWHTGRVFTSETATLIELGDRTGSVWLSLDERRVEQYLLPVIPGQGDVLQVRGKVVDLVGDSMLQHGISVEHLVRVSVAEGTPFDVYQTCTPQASDTPVRLRYKYLELRRPEFIRILETRSRAGSVARNHLAEQGFLEIETPLLEAWDRESVTSFVVPSTHGSAYALPQNVQARKQLLMVGGADRYFQLARCFRRENGLSGGHKLEFTALDLELSYVEQEDVFAVVEGLISRLLECTLRSEMPNQIQRMTYSESLIRYGTDRPDLRFDLAIVDVTCLVDGATSTFLRDVLELRGTLNGVVRVLRIPRDQAIKLSENRTALLGMMNPDPQAVKLSWTRVGVGCALEGPGASVFPRERWTQLHGQVGSDEGDVLVLFSGKDHIRVSAAAGACRVQLAKELGLVDSNHHAFAWITDYPYFGYDTANECYLPVRHPFSRPIPESLSLIQDLSYPEPDPVWDGEGETPSRGVNQEHWAIRAGDNARERVISARCYGYDLVLDGVEVGTGSLRNHNLDTQMRVFSLFGYSQETVMKRFSPVLEALKFGAPPHGGIAIGFDRLLATLLGFPDIDIFNPFPKDALGRDLLFGAPSTIEKELVESLLGR